MVISTADECLDRVLLQTLLHASIVSDMHDMKRGAKRKRRAVLVQSFTLTHPSIRHTGLLEYT